MKFTKNFASTNIFGHKPDGAITFLNAKGQMVGKHPPTVNPPANNYLSLGPLVPMAEGSPLNTEWTFASNYKCYPIDTKPVDGGVAVRVGGSVDACKNIVFKDNPSAINYAKQIADYWETGTVPSAPTGVISSTPESKIVNGGVGSGQKGHQTANPHHDEAERLSSDAYNETDRTKARDLFLKASAMHTKAADWEDDHEDKTKSMGASKAHRLMAVQEWNQASLRSKPSPLMNSGTKEGFKKALDTRSATGAKNAAASAVHFKNEAKRHASGLFVKGKKPDLEKASKAANLATGAAVVADASAREADTAPAYDQGIIAHQAAADAHKAARGGVKGDHQSPSRTKEAAHLKSIEDLKGLKATISTVEPEAKKKDKLANSGTSGVYKEWQTRRGNVSSLIKTSDDASKMEPSPQRFPVYNRSTDAWRATEKAERSGTAEDHHAAAKAHYEAGRQFAEIGPRNKSHDEAYLAHAAKYKELTSPSPPPKFNHPASTDAGNRERSYHRGSDD